MICRRKIRTVVSGLGRISWDFHIPALRRHIGFELVAVYDPLVERVQETQDHFSVCKGYTSYDEMLKEESPELVIIAAPTCFHAEQSITAFRSGVNVVCEKPLARDFNESVQIHDEMCFQKRKLMVYQPHRITGEAIALKEIVDSGILGKIFSVKRTWNMFSRRNDWQAFIANGGGMLNNYGAHFIDQFLYLFGGAFKSIEATTKQVVTVGDAEDFVRILALNGSDISFDLEINMGSAFTERDWIVCGTCGTAKLHDDGWKIKYYRPESLKYLERQSGLAAAGRRYPSEPDIEWQEKDIRIERQQETLFYDHIYQYIAEERPPLVPIESTMELMDTIRKCHESAEAHRTGMHHTLT